MALDWPVIFRWLVSAIVALLMLFYMQMREQVMLHEQRVTALEVAQANNRAEILAASNVLRTEMIGRLEMIASLVQQGNE